MPSATLVPVSDWFERFGWGEVADGFLLGAYPLDAEDVAELAEAGVDEILNLCEDAEYGEGERDAVSRELEAAGIEERRLPLVDYGNLPSERLEQAVTRALASLEAGRRVYLHCRAGWQRSAAVAGGVIALRDGISPQEALERLRERRPSAEPLPHQRADLLRWYAERAGLAPGGR
jgi:atypical dual specificity phosphatase